MRLSLKLYRPEKSKVTRAVAWLSIWALVVFGIYSLFYFLEGIELGFWKQEVVGIPGLKFVVTVGFLISIGMAILFGLIIYLFINTPRIADFLIETEAELRRVTWPTRKEFIGSTIVVLTCVLIFGIFMAIVDTFLVKLLEGVGLFARR